MSSLEEQLEKELRAAEAARTKIQEAEDRAEQAAEVERKIRIHELETQIEKQFTAFAAEEPKLRTALLEFERVAIEVVAEAWQTVREKAERKREAIRNLLHGEGFAEHDESGKHVRLGYIKPIPEWIPLVGRPVFRADGSFQHFSATENPCPMNKPFTLAVSQAWGDEGEK